MALSFLHHVNLHTANLEAMIGFYQGVLGLKVGPRPPLASDGAWLYLGEVPAVHLVAEAKPPATGDKRIDHFAFFCEGLADTVARLRQRGVAYTTNVVAGVGLRQVNVFDPDGNRVELQFAADEQADLSDFAGGPR